MKHAFSTADVPALLEEIKKGLIAPVYLIHGDAFLCQTEFKKILSLLVPKEQQSLNYELLDSSAVSMDEIIGRVHTFPLLPGRKVIAVKGIQAFYSKKNAATILEKAKKAIEKQDTKKASRYFLNALGLLGLGVGDMKDRGSQPLKNVSEGLGGGDWLDPIIAYCVENSLTVPRSENGGALLEQTIVSGIPEMNHLILLADAIDKRKKLYKTIKKVGVVIDCSIAQGSKAADRRRQSVFFQSRMTQAVAKTGKTATPGVFDVLFEKTGPDLRVFHNELEKLIAFVGERKEITPEDVEKTIRKSKHDPLYEMTNALSDRDFPKTLTFMESILDSGFFPLQILSAIINQIRKLILAKDLSQGEYQGKPLASMEYGAFQKGVLPALQQETENPLVRGVHPYVLYKSIAQAENYSMEELMEAMGTCLWADAQMKSSGSHSKWILEKLILNICR